MEEYAQLANELQAVPIGTIYEQFEDGTGRFTDGQTVLIAGIITSIKTNLTKGLYLEYP